MHSEYDKAITRAEARFAPLTAALTRDLGLDVEPVVEQTGGMNMCLAIYWPDGAYVWISDYWWLRNDAIVGLYDSDDDTGTYPDLPESLLATLVPWDEGPSEYIVAPRLSIGLADAWSEWATPIIRAHGAAHGWVSRFEKEASHGA